LPQNGYVGYKCSARIASLQLAFPDVPHELRL
jgi:hypothetical protein